MLATLLENLSHATFAFSMDGKTDMMSLNPLEHTNFEMMGSIFGIGGVLFTILMSRISKSTRSTEEFTTQPSEEAGIQQYP